MANYYTVSPKFWPDAIAMGWRDAELVLALYLLTCGHRNLEGLYRLPWQYIEADLLWQAKKVRDTFKKLVADDFVAYDDGVQVVWVKQALKYHQPKSDKQIAGAINSLRPLPATPLLNALAESADTHSKGFANAIRMAFGLNGNGSTNGSRGKTGTHA